MARTQLDLLKGAALERSAEGRCNSLGEVTIRVVYMDVCIEFSSRDYKEKKSNPHISKSSFGSLELDTLNPNPHGI